MTSMNSLTAQKVKNALESFGYLDGFTIDETGQSFDAPIAQIGYPRETSSNVTNDSSIIAIQQLGGNGSTEYYHDVNMYIHLWSPTNGSNVFPFYMARMNEIMTGLKTNWRDANSNVQMMSWDFQEGGETESGRSTFFAMLRVVSELD